MKKVGLFLLAVVMAVCAVGLDASSALAAAGATLKLGTLGVGADVTIGLHERLNARVNLNYFNYGTSISEDEDEDGSGGGTINPELNLFTVGALLDWHPWAQGFRISAGLYLNKNKLDLTAELNDTVDINDREYALSDLEGTVDFNSLAPYVGLGYGNAVGSDGNWHFSFDIGAMFQGSPQVGLRATASDPALQSQLDADVAEEQKELEDDLGVFTVYPVVSLGVSYRF
jgi:hypothetical protein